MKMMYKGEQVFVAVRQYANGRPAIVIEDEERQSIATATINMPELPLEENFVVIKDYSENEGMLKALVTANIVSRPVFHVPAGYAMAPVCALNVDLDKKVL